MVDKDLKRDPLEKNNISLAGEFAVLSQLALRGYDANMTLGHTKNVDILVSNPITGRMFKLEVKTTRANNMSISGLFGHTLNWVMSEKHETISSPDLYYCFVQIKEEDNSTYTFKFFIVPSKVVSKYVKEEHQYWLKVKEGEANPNSIRRFRMGLEATNYNIETPLASDYENKWDFGF